MIIRNYRKEDEAGWLKCRVLSFLDISYYDDIMRKKDTYNNPSISLVAEEEGVIVGFMDMEYEIETGDTCYLKGEKGAVIWNLGVLPEYRNKGVASMLFDKAKGMLEVHGIKRIEVWTQDDELPNRWYRKKGFELREAYLNAYVKGTVNNLIIKEYINLDKIGPIYGVRNINFEAPIERKDELLPICYRLHEVRVYELIL